MSVAVALIRGNSLNAWEGKLWEKLPGDFSVTGFCSKKNLYPIDTLAFPVKRLSATTDSKLCNGWASYVLGKFQKMSGLEKKLAAFDIAHTTEIYNYFTWQAVRAKQINPRLKVVTTVWDNSFARFDSVYVAGRKPPAWWTAKMKQLIAANAKGVDMFLPVSSSSEALLKHYGVPTEKIKRVTPGLLEYPREEGGGLLEKYRLPAGIYLMVNRLTKEKGIYDVLAAWKQLLVAEPTAQLAIIGDGPERETMLATIVQEKLRPSIRYIPTMPNHELRQLYQHARALILASVPTPVWEEQFGYVLAEAISSGCPVISTTSGAIPEVVGEAGILVPPGNPPALANALIQMENVETRAKLSALALKAKERFSAARFQKEVGAVYNELV